MLTLSAVRNWLKTYDIAQHYFVGKLDTSKENVLCVYSRKRSGTSVTTLDGLPSYDIKAISLLLHYNKNAVQAEQTAITLFEKIRAERELIIENIPIHYIAMQVPEPVAVGTDDKGVVFLKAVPLLENFKSENIEKTYNLLFDKSERDKIDALKLGFIDWLIVITEAITLVAGDEVGEALTPGMT